MSNNISTLFSIQQDSFNSDEKLQPNGWGYRKSHMLDSSERSRRPLDYTCSQISSLIQAGDYLEDVEIDVGFPIS